MTRVGESTERPVNVRIIAATNADLRTAVGDGSFRLDLFHRLDVARIDLVPLRARREDIPLLAARLLERHAGALRRRVPTISQAATRRLVAHDWPGNVRELENVLHRAFILARPGAPLEPHDFLLPAPRAPRAVSPEYFASTIDLPLTGLDLPALKMRLEGELIKQAFERSGGAQAGAAELLRIPRTSLRNRITRPTA